MIYKLKEVRPSKTHHKLKKKKKTFKDDADVYRWFHNPEKHPINDTYLSPVSPEYADFYDKSVKIMKKKYGRKFSIYVGFPDNHRLFNIDFLYYTFVSKNRGGSSEMPINDTIICELLKSGIDNTLDKNTILETEVELVRNRFSKTKIQYTENNNFDLCKDLLSSLQEQMILTLLKGNNGDFKDITIHTIAQRVNEYSRLGRDDLKQALNLVQFLKTYKFSNRKIVIDYINEIVRDELYDADTRKSLEDGLVLYNAFQLVYQDIEDLLNKDSDIVDNYENKQFNIIPDPLDQYFNKYEDALKVIQNPRYRNLINLTTFKPTDTKLFLTESQYKNFLKNKKKISEQYAVSKKDYDKTLAKYNSIPRAEKPSKSPSPPKRPTLKLENGKIYQLGLRDPEYIKKSLLKEFNEEYQKVKIGRAHV